MRQHGLQGLIVEGNVISTAQSAYLFIAADVLRMPPDSDTVTHTDLYRSLCVVVLAAIAGCQDRASSAIANQFAASGNRTVDLASAWPEGWDRVCVLGPYSNNAAAAQVLGFDWDVESQSSISTKDGISLLLFVQGSSISRHIDHRRNQGDFSNLSGRCFRREQAKFKQVTHPTNGWPGPELSPQIPLATQRLAA